ncbi:MAG: hypothetical protein AAF962_00075 [Actinomycetota bacterium]
MASSSPEDPHVSDQSPATAVPAADRAPSTKEEWEQVRRSVAMLPPGAWALRREEALRALRSLVRSLER